MCFAPQRRARFQHLNFKKCSKPVRFLHSWQRNCFATTPCTFSSSQLPKVIRAWCALCILIILTSKMCCGHNGVHFFDSSAQLPKVLREWCDMCFAPQRCALFRHLNFQRCSGREVSLAISLRIVLRATTACNFSSLISPDGSASATLASLLFHCLGQQIIGKTQCFATFLPFRAHTSFFWLFLFSDLLSSLLFSDLPTSVFPSLHVVGS